MKHYEVQKQALAGTKLLTSMILFVMTALQAALGCLRKT